MNVDLANVVAEISSILSEEFVDADAEESAIGADTSLLSAGLSLDSVSLLQLIAAVEDRFDIEFTDDDLSVEVFESVGSVARTTVRKMGDAGD